MAIILSLWNNSWGSTTILPSSNFTAAFEAIVTTWSFLRKEWSYTFLPLNELSIFSPTSFALSALTLSSATMPVVMLRNDGSAVNRFLRERKVTISWASLWPRSCLAFVPSLCCSLVLFTMSVGFCMALLTSAHAGMDITQAKRCASVIPRPRVSPPLAFKLRIRTCSITKSVERRDQ